MQISEICQRCMHANSTKCLICEVDGARSIYPSEFCDKSSVASAAQLLSRALIVPSGYDALGQVLQEALNQAALGKGVERHGNGEIFENQRTMQIARAQGTAAGLLFQAHKKLHEGEHMADFSRAKHEFLGAIVYIAFAVLLGEELAEKNGAKNSPDGGGK